MAVSRDKHDTQCDRSIASEEPCRLEDQKRLHKLDTPIPKSIIHLNKNIWQVNC